MESNNKIKNYIKKHLEPLIIGFLSCMISIYILNSIFDIMIKIVILLSK